MSKILIVDIEGTNGCYAVGEDGVVYSHKRTPFKPLVPVVTCEGYHRVKVGRSVKGRCELVHRLVAEAFVPNPFFLETVDHINGVKSDNRAVNLQWMSRVDNVKKSLQKEYSLISPKGVIHTFIGQAEFCRAYGLTQANISKVLLGERSHCKGWRKV